MSPFAAQRRAPTENKWGFLSHRAINEQLNVEYIALFPLYTCNRVKNLYTSQLLKQIDLVHRLTFFQLIKRGHLS